MNVHALNIVSAETLQLQLDQLVTSMEGHQGPLLLAGDFNVWTDEKQQRLRTLARRLSLTEVTFDELVSRGAAMELSEAVDCARNEVRLARERLSTR